MKKSFLTAFILITCSNLLAQYVGVNNNNPATSLDVKGAIRTRPDTVMLTQDYQVLDVSNTAFIRLQMAENGVPDNAIILLSPGKDGQRLRIESLIHAPTNGGTQSPRIVSNSFLSNGKKIQLQNDEVFRFATIGRYIDLFYSDFTRWQ